MFEFLKKDPSEVKNPDKSKGSPEDLDALSAKSVRARMKIAKNSKTRQETLAYLAEKDPDASVRKAVAYNKSMTMKMSTVLAVDPDEDVRMALARRLLKLLPNVSQDRQSQLYAYAVQSLGTLALDEVLKIRLALSSTLKDHAFTPPKVAGQLARDVERDVSEPILRFCTALSDGDLLDILKNHPASWVVEAVATRKEVSSPVSAGVIGTDDIPGGAALLNNAGAAIEEELLVTIVEKAKSYPEWQKPMVGRAYLPIAIVRELAEYVDASVRDLLMQRKEFDEETTEEIAEIFRRRVDFISEEGSKEESIEAKVRRLAEAGELNEDVLSDALAMREREFVYDAIAVMAGTSYTKVEKIFEMNKAKPIVALAWRADLSMRTALQLQKELGQVPPTELLYPRGGVGYPLTDDDLEWQLEFLGIAKKKKNKK